LRSLSLCYGEGVAVTLAEPSASPVVRIECAFNPSLEHRESIRKHLFEVNNWSDKNRQYVISLATIESLRNHLRECFGLRKTKNTNLSLEIDVFCNSLKQVTGQYRGNIARDLIDANAKTAKVLQERRQQYRDICRQVFGSSFQCFRNANQELSLGRYLGFVDMRLYSEIASVALALLVPPRKLRHDPSAFIITGNYGEIFGGHGFECSVYSMQDPLNSDGKCVQSTLVMALALLSDRGAKVIGTLDITGRAMSKDSLSNETNKAMLPEIVSKQDEYGIEGLQEIGGLAAEQTIHILNKNPSVGVCSSLFQVTRKNLVESPKRQLIEYQAFARLIDAYVQARCPVICFVNFAPIPTEGINHSVLVTGIRRGNRSRSPSFKLKHHSITDVVYHDPSRAPFCVKTIEELFEASENSLSKNGTVNGTLNAVFAAPKRIMSHAWDYLKRMRSSKDPFVMEYVAPAFVEKVDYEIRLLHRDDIQSYVARQSLEKSISLGIADENGSLQNVRDALEAGWHWVFIGYLDDEPKSVVAYFAERESSKQRKFNVSAAPL
jgi:hypothetical protein